MRGPGCGVSNSGSGFRVLVSLLGLKVQMCGVLLVFLVGSDLLSRCRSLEWFRA